MCVKDPVGMRLLATLRVKMVILTPTKNQIFFRTICRYTKILCNLYLKGLKNRAALINGPCKSALPPSRNMGWYTESSEKPHSDGILKIGAENFGAVSRPVALGITMSCSAASYLNVRN